jgi:hypothetical protein
MSTSEEFLERVDQWFTIEQPVTYWSFWLALLRLVPVFLLLFGLVAAIGGVRFAVISFAPLPYVLVAATVGYAVRNFDAGGILVSVVAGLVYGFTLWLSGIAGLILSRPTVILSVSAVLAFLALSAGFASSTLHGQAEKDEFREKRREYQQEQER